VICYISDIENFMKTEDAVLLGTGIGLALGYFAWNPRGQEIVYTYRRELTIFSAGMLAGFFLLSPTGRGILARTYESIKGKGALKE